MTESITQPFDKKILRLFYILGAVFLLSLFLAFYTDTKALLLIPFLLLGAMITVLDYKLLFFILITFLPVSFEVYLGSNAFVQLPTEPIMIIFMFIVVFRPWIGKKYDVEFNHHPISLLLIALLLWLIPVTLNSTDILLSLKFLVSKYWYIATFFYGVGIFIRHFNDWRKMFWFLYIPILIISLIITVRHAMLGFEFYWASYVDSPFFINHVIYGCYLTMILPFVFFARNWYKKGSFKRNLLSLSSLFFVFAIFTTYTRASWLAIPVMVFFYYIFKWKLIKHFLVIAFLALATSVVFLLYNNKYIDYAPNFETTIFHKGDIAGHLEATYTFEDVSGMERVYRWVAAKNMFLARPFLGVGTNCFYDNYKHYSVRSFETYVSGNPEKSTVHNYFILVLTEQGFIGFLIFTALCVAVFLYGQKLYHKLQDPQLRQFSLAVTMSLIAMIFHLLLNDLIETDKLGTLFFMGLALLVRVDLWAKKTGN